MLRCGACSYGWYGLAGLRAPATVADGAAQHDGDVEAWAGGGGD